MGDKSTQKRKYIIDKAKSVFCKNGYSAVTMKDIVDACEISRGGLYLYFTSTKEVFEAVLQEENINTLEMRELVKNQKATPGEVMLMYLENQKKLILKKKDNITKAVYEYFFECKFSKNDNPVRKQFETDVETISMIISEGVSQEWMVCEDIPETAKNIAYTLEGLKVSSQTIGLSETDVDKEIEYIMGMLGMVVK